MSSSNNLIDIPEKILVIAKSARMLTRYLSDLGYGVVAVDCFGDCDTRQMALDFRLVDNLGLASVGLALAELTGRHELRAVIYGSGFEGCSDTLHALQTEWPIWGNPPACFDAVQNKVDFFLRLNKLQIEYPPVSFVRPNECRQWLQKPLRGEGGLGVRRYNMDAVSDGRDVYWQRYVAGETLSVLFVAADDDVEIIGYQQQLSVDHSEQEFLFAGVISKPNLPVALRKRVEQWVLDLARCFRLQGLNGLDFIHDHGRCYVLEINARPPASLQLYGAEVLDKHIQAVVEGRLGNGEHHDEWAAYKIVYARRGTVIVSAEDWPEWVVDRPFSGSVIGRGEPVCSIIARAKSRWQLLASLQHKQLQIEQLLATGI